MTLAFHSVFGIPSSPSRRTARGICVASSIRISDDAAMFKDSQNSLPLHEQPTKSILSGTPCVLTPERSTAEFVYPLNVHFSKRVVRGLEPPMCSPVDTQYAGRPAPSQTTPWNEMGC